MDYRALLVKYMALVIDEEGVSFVDGLGDTSGMSEQEKAELEYYRKNNNSSMKPAFYKSISIADLDELKKLEVEAFDLFNGRA